MPQEIKSYLQLGEVFKRGYWYLAEDYIVIRMYGIDPPHIYPKLLTPRNFVLVEYIKQMVEVDNLHFVKSKKKGRDNFPIVMGGYAINNNKFLEQITKVLKKMI